jgi:hypothetical protein
MSDLHYIVTPTGTILLRRDILPYRRQTSKQLTQDYDFYLKVTGNVQPVGGAKNRCLDFP